MTDGQRFAFTKIVVDDLDAESAFYSAVLGLVEKQRTTAGKGDAAYTEAVLSFTHSDEPSLLLLKRLGREAPAPGEAVLGFAVPDVDRVVRAAKAAGGTVRVEPRSIPPHGLRVVQRADPEGHLLEIVQQL